MSNMNMNKSNCVNAESAFHYCSFGIGCEYLRQSQHTVTIELGLDPKCTTHETKWKIKQIFI